MCNKLMVTIEYFAEPEHKELIDKAEAQLKEYEAYLLAKLECRLFGGRFVTSKQPDDIRQAQCDFFEDPFRKQMVKKICDMKLMFERPMVQIRE